MNNIKVQTKMIMVILATMAALVLCTIFSAQSMMELQSRALETMETDERDSYDEQIKQQVDNVISLCQTIYDQYQEGVYTEAEAKKLAAVSVESLIQKHPLALSGGQCQRVAFASVLVLNSDIIVIDEPTSQLDPEGTEDVFKIIQKLKEQGKTVIISEHKIDLLAQYCDEIIAMSEGKIIAKGPTREVLSNPVLAEYGVAVPQVIDLFMKMQAAGKPMKTVPINLEEAIGQLCARREEMA